MKITYIHHSGFLAETAHTLLLFDYVGGPLPQLNPEKELLVFASHRHADHFDPLIFEFAETHPRVHFFLSFDIRAKKIPPELSGLVTGLKARTVTEYRGAGTAECTAAPVMDTADQICSPDDIFVRIRTYRSTDEGVAFVVETDGQTIYHAGDLNDWHWDEETAMYNNNMKANYLRELRAMYADSVHPDAAMIPVDGRLEGAFYRGLAEFMEEVGAEYIFPMHFWKDYSVIDRIRSHACAKAYRDRIMQIREEGQSFHLRRSQIHD